MRTAIFRLSASIIIGCALVACGTTEPAKPWKLPEPKTAQDAIIFGSMIIEEKDDKKYTADHVRLLQRGKIYSGMGQRAIGEKVTLFYGGQFVTVVPPGVYNLSSFYRNDNRTSYSMGSGLEFTVAPGQIYYVGSFQAKHERDQFFIRPGTFSVQRVPTPGERELLQWLATKAEGTRWEAKVRQRAGTRAAKSAEGSKTR